MDPTAACNLHCKGCWAAEYGHALKLSLDEMRSIVKQGRALGTHFYMLTGGEPLIRKDDIVTLAKENPECTFLIYTNATLVDQKFCEDMKERSLYKFVSSLMQVMIDYTGLEEGFLVAPPKYNRRTRRLEAMLDDELGINY